MSTSQIRIGLVGAGSIAQVAELPALAADPRATIAGVVTATPDGAAKNVARWPIERAYDSFEQMVAEARLDATFVLTPKQVHTPYVVASLEAGLDVFCEKPLSTSLEEARRMAELADERDRLLMVGFNRRYAEVYLRAHEEFSRRDLRFCVAQKNRPGSEYRATIENAIHMVDLMRWFCGEAQEVTAHAVAPDPYEETGTLALILFEGGRVGTLVAARCAGEWDERLDLYGELTSVRVTAPDSVAVSTDGETTVLEMRPRASGWAQVNRTMGFGPEVEHFLDCVESRQRPRTDGHDAVRTQALVTEIVRAAGLPLDERAEVAR